MDEPNFQLQMVWPDHRFSAPPSAVLPAAYALRLYQHGDEPRYYEVMAAAGWPGWDDERLAKWTGRIPPAGWFMVIHAASGQIVASAMGLHDPSDQHPNGGELGWVACDPAHRGRGLGMVVSAAVTARLIALGYRNIHLYTEDFRLAAIKTYLKLGYVPFLDLPEMAARWQTVCAQIGWPYAPEGWRQA